MLKRGGVSAVKSTLAKKEATVVEKVTSSSPKVSKDKSKLKSPSKKDNLQFWQDKGILLDDLQDRRFGHYLWAWQMEKLVEQPMKVNGTLVEEFYDAAPEELDTLFEIRGRQLDISPETICSYYGLMEADHQGDRGMDASELTEDELRSLRRFHHPTQGSERDVLASELDIHNAICLTWLRDNVNPRNKAAGSQQMKRSSSETSAKGNYSSGAVNLLIIKKENFEFKEAEVQTEDFLFPISHYRSPREQWSPKQEERCVVGCFKTTH